jgi:hypothetical protein
MNDDLLKKVALLQIKEKAMKDSGDVLTDLADMQALRQFSADLKELIDEQHAAGAIPADPLSALRERLMKVVDALRDFQAWQNEQSGELAPFLEGNPKVSLGQINSIIGALPSVIAEEQESIKNLISSCDSEYWDTKGGIIRLSSELEVVQEALLPELAKLYVYDKKWSPELISSDDGNKGCTLKETLGADATESLHKLVERHEKQAAAATEIGSLLQQGNYKTAQAKAMGVMMLSAEGKSQVGFTDIDFANQAKEITKYDKLVKQLKSYHTSNKSPIKVVGEIVAHDLHSAETMLKDAQGELREDLSAGVTRLKAHIAKAKKNAKTKRNAIVFGVVIIALAASWAMYVNHTAHKAKKEEAAATEREAGALVAGDYSNLEVLFKRAFTLHEVRGGFTGWIKRKTQAGRPQLLKYKNGAPNGISIILDSEDRIYRVLQYADAKALGEYIEFDYYQNGAKKSETNYKYGNKHGLETLWDEEGNTIDQTKWQNGKRVE